MIREWWRRWRIVHRPTWEILRVPATQQAGWLTLENRAAEGWEPVCMLRNGVGDEYLLLKRERI